MVPPRTLARRAVGTRGGSARSEPPRFSVKPPIAATDVAAGGTGTGKVFPAAIGGLGEIAADHAAAAIFPHRGEGAAIAAIVPFIRPADIAIQTLAVDAEGHRLVFAIDVAADDVAEQAAQHHAADHRAAVAATGRAADQAARQRPEDRARRGVGAPAIGLVAALLIIGRRRGRRRRRTIIAISITIAIEAAHAAHAVITAVAAVIAVMVPIAVIAVGVVAW